MKERGHTEILRLLLDDLTRAHAANQSARLHFDCIVQEASLGTPRHDGSKCLHTAGIEFRASLDRYIRALKRYTAFTMRQIVPEDISHTED